MAEQVALFAPGELGDYARFTVRAVRRHWRASLLLVALAVAGAWVTFRVVPRVYVAEARLLAVPEQAGPARKAKDQDPDAVLSAAIVLNHGHLEQLVDGHALVEHWWATRPLTARVGEKVRALLGAPPATDADVRLALVAMLEEAITVKTEPGRAVIQVAWHDPAMAARLAQACQEHFLEARREADVSAAAREVASVQQQVDDSQARVAALASSMENELEGRRKGARFSSVAALQAEGRWRQVPDATLAALRLELISVRKQLEALESERRARLTALTALLTEQEALYAPAHPVRLDTAAKVESLRQPSAELLELRAREQALLGEYVRGGGKESELSTDAPKPWPAELREDTPATEIRKIRLAVELEQLSRLRLQLTQVRGELEATRETVGQRYAVIRPADVPSTPSGAPLPVTLVGAGLAGVLLAVFAAVARDLASGRVLERWQVQRSLGLRVLAEVERP